MKKQPTEYIGFLTTRKKDLEELARTKSALRHERITVTALISEALDKCYPVKVIERAKRQ